MKVIFAVVALLVSGCAASTGYGSRRRASAYVGDLRVNEAKLGGANYLGRPGSVHGADFLGSNPIGTADLNIIGGLPLNQPGDYNNYNYRPVYRPAYGPVYRPAYRPVRKVVYEYDDNDQYYGAKDGLYARSGLASLVAPTTSNVGATSYATNAYPATTYTDYDYDLDANYYGQTAYYRQPVAVQPVPVRPVRYAAPHYNEALRLRPLPAVVTAGRTKAVGPLGTVKVNRLTDALGNDIASLDYVGYDGLIESDYAVKTGRLNKW